MLQKTVLYYVPDCDLEDLVEFTLQQGSLERNSTGEEFIHIKKKKKRTDVGAEQKSCVCAF